MRRRWLQALLVGSIGLMWAGCHPSDDVMLDDSKNPLIKSGLRSVSALDYDEAIEYFETALEANPRSVRAHYELGLLHEKQKQDFVTAIYHYQRVLKLKSDGYPADNVKLLIDGCRQELVKNQALGPVMQEMQVHLEELKQTNSHLRREVVQLRNQLELAQKQNETEQEPADFRTATHRTQLPRTTFTPDNRQPGPTDPNPRSGQIRPRQFRPSPTPNPPTGQPRMRYHTVKKGETLYSIARYYNVNVRTLQLANRGVRPESLTIGRRLRVPAR